MKNKVFLTITTVIAIVLMSFSFQQTTISSTHEIIVPEGGINFYDGSWEDALKMAKDENKLIFIDAMASWCGPCKLMDSKTFSDPAVAKYFNENFVNVKMDMEKHPDGPSLSQKFEISAYPTLLFVDKSGKIVKKQIGFRNADQLMEYAKSVK